MCSRADRRQLPRACEPAPSAASCAQDCRALRALAARWLLTLLLAWSAFAAGSCYSQHPCAAESCDGRDNDCDGKIDETFRDAAGYYADVEHCGSCDVRCREVFPAAQEVACTRQDGAAVCRISVCPPGERAAGSGSCVADLPVDCLPCAADEECALRSEGARCVTDALGAPRCAAACTPERPCRPGYVCPERGLCSPRSGACACDAQMEAVSFACELHAPAAPGAPGCPGARQCTAAGLSACEPVLSERCNQRDDERCGQGRDRGGR